MSGPLLIPSRPFVKWACFQVVYNEVDSVAFFRRTRKQKAHEPKFVGLMGIRDRPCGIRTCDQRIKSPRRDWLDTRMDTGLQRKLRGIFSSILYRFLPGSARV
jgi:hypothetical protein